MAVRKLGDVAVGTIAKIKIDGSVTEFIIANQESSRTALIRKDIQNMGSYTSQDEPNVTSECNLLYNRMDPEIRKYILDFGFYGSKVGVPSVNQLQNGWAYFSSNQRRIAYYRGEAKEWWTSTTSYLGRYYFVDEQGSTDSYYSSGSKDCGIRPAFYLDPNLFMLDDGTIITNQSPTAPASITASNVMGGQQASITLGAASDPDGTVINYVYERSIDTGMWTQFASTASLSIIDQISDDWDTVRYRAKAVDDKGAEGPYATSQTYTVIHNQPPTAPASITASNVMGGQEATVTLEAATDSDGEIINYTYERQVDGGSWTQFASENSLTVTDQIDDSWTTVAYRARAMDDMGAEGPYAASEVYTVVHNLPPTAPGSIQVTNVTTGQEATVTLTAATDPDGTVASYIYERSVDGAEFQPFANVNALTQTDHISGDWGTVAYRACAVDDDGAAGPYVTSETKTVTTGLVTIAGPAADLGEKPMPFAFWFSCGVSDQTTVQDIAVRVTVDGREFFTGTLDSGAAKGLYIDTRFRGAGQHTIAVTASKEDYQPAAASYTFTVPSVTLPYEGRAEMPQNSAGQPVWWYGLARFIFGEDGKDLPTLMQEMQAASLKMVTGSYQGTGQSGSSNPNILAAAFTPKAVMLSSGSDAVLLAIPEEGDTGTTDGISYTKASTGVSWFAGDAAAQYNESGKIYRYVMFG